MLKQSSLNFWMVSPALILGLHCAVALGNENPLPGCWKGEEVVQFLGNGASRKDQSAGCLLEFSEEKITSRCVGRAGPVEIAYAYKIVRPGVYSANLVAHSQRQDVVGGQREYEYKVQDDRLFITTYPQTTKPAPPTAAVRVESISKKVTCP